jgi:hypothetical protein
VIIDPVEIRTEPTTAARLPTSSIHRRPNMSLRPPAIEKDIDEAIDHPPTIQAVPPGSPTAVSIWTITDVTVVKPIATGPTNDSPRNYAQLEHPIVGNWRRG